MLKKRRKSLENRPTNRKKHLTCPRRRPQRDRAYLSEKPTKEPAPRRLGIGQGSTPLPFLATHPHLCAEISDDLLRRADTGLSVRDPTDGYAGFAHHGTVFHHPTHFDRSGGSASDHGIFGRQKKSKTHGT